MVEVTSPAARAGDPVARRIITQAATDLAITAIAVGDALGFKGDALPLALAGFSFGAVTTLRWLAAGGRADAVALAGVPLRSVAFQPHELPLVPDGTFIVAAELDQFGTAAELRAAYPRARIVEVRGVDHFFGAKRNEVGVIMADQIATDLRIH